MRGWLLLIAVLLAAPANAVARPKLAIAPLAGDEGNKVGNAVAKAAEDDAQVVGPKETGRAIDKLELSGDLGKKEQKKLRAKLEVDVVVQGKVEGKGKQKTLELRMAGKGIKPSTFRIKFKSALSTAFRDDVRTELRNHLGESGDEPDDEEDRPAKPARIVDEPKHAEKPKHRVAKGEDDEDSGAVHKRRRKHKGGDDDEDAPHRHAVTQVAVRASAGPGFSRRTLTYAATGTMQPQHLGTAAASGHVEAEIYPGATSTLKGPAAGIGLFGDFDQTVGLKIRLPGTTTDVPISQGHYAIGARYRVILGDSTVAFGVAYERRRYIANRSKLAMPTALDTPDVDYTAIAPGAIARIAAGPTADVFLGANVQLLLGAGGITSKDYYGFADILAFEGTAGADLALGANYGLRFAAELQQVGFTFRGNAYSMMRGVTAATDRTLSLTATFAVTY